VETLSSDIKINTQTYEQLKRSVVGLNATISINLIDVIMSLINFFTSYLKLKRFNDRDKFARFSGWRHESCYVVFGKVNCKVHYSSPCKGRCQRKGDKINLLVNKHFWAK